MQLKLFLPQDIVVLQLSEWRPPIFEAGRPSGYCIIHERPGFWLAGDN